MAAAPDIAIPVRPAFHEGERALHEACGIDGKMAQIGPRAIRPTIRPDDAQFIVRRPFLALGVRDRDGHPWATLVAGAPGWIAVPDPSRLAIRTLPRADDPAAAGIAADAPVALLAIDFETANRCRVNGHTIARDAGGFDLAIAEAFGNCPKYIRQRRLIGTDAPVAGAATGAPTVRTDPPDAAARRLIGRADTFFIATAHAEYGCDVSHRGGPAGFVAFDGDDAFVFPDYRGNFFFNTLGNLVVDPRAGLCFFGPDSGDLLQVTGRMQIAWQPPDDAPAGAERMWRFIVEGWSLRPNVLPLRFEDGAPSPYLPKA
jgi:predicted pyridoxine 5'-phosphate oxidase superfamily flavin-nucleotide-binding protein